MNVLEVMDFFDLLRTVFYYAVTVGCFSIYIGLLVFTVGLRELQTNLKIREIGKNLFKRLL